MRKRSGSPLGMGLAVVCMVGLAACGTELSGAEFDELEVLGEASEPLLGAAGGKKSKSSTTVTKGAHGSSDDDDDDDDDAELSWLESADPEPDPWHDEEGESSSGSKDAPTDEAEPPPADPLPSDANGKDAPDESDDANCAEN
ncbi:MAG: hypothetical protein EXR75_10645 [Myxococcales bacterium]|nr:hypothetical protein [Myxococcales bacterium]